jgi:hypothetical protein
MSSLSARQDIKGSHDAQMLRVVIELFDEFPVIPLTRVIRRPQARARELAGQFEWSRVAVRCRRCRPAGWPVWRDNPGWGGRLPAPITAQRVARSTGESNDLDA